ncbi:hypothetical protein Hanom_Chr06g00519811 [Helianthus anomalus]
MKTSNRAFTTVSNSRDSPKWLSIFLHRQFIHSRIFNSNHGSQHQNSLNYLCTLEKSSQNTDFHPIIDVLSSSKYKTLLTCNAPIHQETLREFWKNAKLQTQDKKAWVITSKVGEVLVSITPQTISEVFQMNDIIGKNSFSKDEYQTDLIERGYKGQMTKATLQRENFHLP